jgi:ribosome maturation factor RimP
VGFSRQIGKSKNAKRTEPNPGKLRACRPIGVYRQPNCFFQPAADNNRSAPSTLGSIFPTLRFFAILNSTVETMQWAEAHFFIGLSMKREDAISRITAIAEQAATPAGLEVVEVELKGSGRSHLLRIYIDKPEGVTHADCELVSREVSAALDLEDPIPGTYELEVSSPGVERKLGKWQDWRRFEGKKVKVVLKEALPGGTPDLADAPALKYFDGVISRAADDSTGARTVTVELPGGRQVTFPVEQVDHANLKFEW